jgi:peptide/nickel transport system permease protein
VSELLISDETLEQTPDRASEPTTTIEGRTPTQLAWRRIKRDRVSLVSAVVIVLLVLIAVFAPLITRALGIDPYVQDRGAKGLTLDGVPVGPSSKHWFGTDEIGRDVLARTIYGTRISMLVGVVATLLQVVIGVFFGLIAGYFAGKTDTFLSRFIDVVLSFPFLLTALSVFAITHPSVWITIGIIAFFGWSNIARIVRGQVLGLREREFVEAARSLGSGNIRIMLVDLLPNLTGPLIVYSTLLIPVNMIAEATLSFLGVGVVPPTASWGEMLSNAADLYKVAWWYLVFPGVALVVTTLAFNLLGDGLRDALDPRADRVLNSK